MTSAAPLAGKWPVQAQQLTNEWRYTSQAMKQNVKEPCAHGTP